MSSFSFNKTIIGMIHVDALPGTPKNSGSVKSIIESAKNQALRYRSLGIDALMIENMHDVPYLNRKIGPEITSVMSIILYEIKKETNLPCGIQILAGANKEALASAHSAGADFIRAEGFVFAHVADEGFFNSDAGELLRYRKQIGAENILVLTDIKKKHSSHSITGDTDIIDTAKAAEFFLSDGVIITGSATGTEPLLQEIINVKKNISIPVLAGSGINAENVKSYLEYCDGLIIGSYFKKEGKWSNPIDPERVNLFMNKISVS
ncbi:MAG: BtpA family membrane complex biogenesis protein [Ignavibacteriae bacterium HGW-Ignavibacteriae-3]|nr:MAG: BtpA family membrane complex biogenesis protein [Ignavibacteriae bacterium HGW-Ignavibacteriae-3]